MHVSTSLDKLQNWQNHRPKQLLTEHIPKHQIIHNPMYHWLWIWKHCWRRALGVMVREYLQAGIESSYPLPLDLIAGGADTFLRQLVCQQVPSVGKYVAGPNRRTTCCGANQNDAMLFSLCSRWALNQSTTVISGTLSSCQTTVSSASGGRGQAVTCVDGLWTAVGWILSRLRTFFITSHYTGVRDSTVIFIY